MSLPTSPSTSPCARPTSAAAGRFRLESCRCVDHSAIAACLAADLPHLRAERARTQLPLGLEVGMHGGGWVGGCERVTGLRGMARETGHTSGTVCVVWWS
eukprot:2192922-Prymnesium_polylepis.2